jgi:hypothetical protein
MGENLPTLTTLVALIARSPIMVASPFETLPAGYGETDAFVLAWIAAEGRRIGRGFPLM